MKIVFFGNTKHSLIGAKIIHKELVLSQVVTIPHSPLEQFANEQKIPCLIVTKLTDEVIAEIAKVEPDFSAGGQISMVAICGCQKRRRDDDLSIHVR